jgi:hypothetical protein
MFSAFAICSTPGRTSRFSTAPASRLMLDDRRRRREPVSTASARCSTFFVTDIEGVQRDLAAKGVEFFEQPHLIARTARPRRLLTAFNDSEGNPMGIMEERQRSA